MRPASRDELTLQSMPVGRDLLPHQVPSRAEDAVDTSNLPQAPALPYQRDGSGQQWERQHRWTGAIGGKW